MDAHALLLDAAGTVRTDRDLVFFNAPRHISQAVTLDQEPASGTARLSVSLPRTEDDVQRIVVSGSLDDGSFGDVGELTLTVHAADGPIAQFDIVDSDAVAAMMFGEFYRRDGAWRFRAIGQGWASGLSGLVTEFGVSVEEPEDRAAAARRERAASTQRDRSASAGRSAPHSAGRGSEEFDARRATGEDPARQRGGSADRSTHHTPGTGTPSPSEGDDVPSRSRSAATSSGAAARARPTATPSAGSGTTPTTGTPSPIGGDDARSPSRSAASSSSGAATRARPTATSFANSGTTRPSLGGTVDLSRRQVDAPPAPPPNPERADWHPDPEDSARMRWWDGSEWTSATQPPPHPSHRHCPRCGRPRRRKLFGGLAPCGACASEVEEFLTHWHSRAQRVLISSGTRDADWAALWASLRYQRIDERLGREALRDVGLSHVERLVTFAFADGEVEQAELDTFEHAVAELALSGPLIDDLRRRMHRGRTLSRLRGGELPVVRTPGLHLDPEERVHLDLPAQHVRQLARGPKVSEGRLIGSNKKLRFVGVSAGIELPWSRVVSVYAERGTVVLAATSARGGATFAVDDADYVAAALEGALRVAKRLILTPGQQDTRSIPQEVKAEVWQRDGGKCVECGDGHYLEFDHIIPLSRGGATSAANLQILCRACNRAKGARI